MSGWLSIVTTTLVALVIDASNIDPDMQAERLTRVQHPHADDTGAQAWEAAYSIWEEQPEDQPGGWEDNTILLIRKMLRNFGRRLEGCHLHRRLRHLAHEVDDCAVRVLHEVDWGMGGKYQL